MSTAPPPARRSSYGLTALLALVLVAATGGYYLYERSQNQPPGPVDEFAALKDYFRQLAAGPALAEGYADADGDLVADPPKDGRFREVKDAIGFSLVGTGDEERRKADEAAW